MSSETKRHHMPTVDHDLRWFDEGDGYQHAHATDDCIGTGEVADFVATPEYTEVSLKNLPPMTEDRAKAFVGLLYRYAGQLLAIGGKASGE